MGVCVSRPACTPAEVPAPATVAQHPQVWWLWVTYERVAIEDPNILAGPFLDQNNQATIA